MQDDGLLQYLVSRIDEFEYDVDKLADWYVEKNYNDQKYGDKFILEIESVLEKLNTFPFIHRRYSDDFDESIRRLDLHDRNVAILYKVYDEEDKDLEVIAAMAFHTLQDPAKADKIIAERVLIADEMHEISIHDPLGGTPDFTVPSGSNSDEPSLKRPNTPTNTNNR